MTTYVFPAGKQIYQNFNSAISRWDAVTNDPYFLCDYIPGLGSAFSRSYPCDIQAAASGAVFEGGRFYGNIAESAARRTVYNGAYDDFNSSLVLIRNGLSLTFRDMVFGISGNLDSGYIDGIRTSAAGNTLIEDCEFYQCRDDVIEADGGGNVTMRRCFIENAYVWISCTASQPSKVIRLEDCLVYIKRWRELDPSDVGVITNREEFQCGPPFKTGGSVSGSPQFALTNVTMAMPRSFAGDVGYSRLKSGLARMSCVNCTLLSYEGTMTNDSGLRDAFLAAGWNLIEGSAAVTEWEAKRAEWFGGPTAPPIVIDTLTSPCTLNVQVGAAATALAVVDDETVIANTSENQTSVTSGSTVAAGAGTNRQVLFLVSYRKPAAGLGDDVALSWGGFPLTRVYRHGFNALVCPQAALFACPEADIPASAATITVTSSGMDCVHVRKVTVEGAKQTSSFGTSGAEHFNSNQLSQTVTRTKAEASSWIIGHGVANGSTTLSFSLGDLEFTDNAGTLTYAGAAFDKVASTGDRTQVLSSTTSRRLVLACVEMFAAA